MTQADSVHSTPRSDSSPFRRLAERERDQRSVLAELFQEDLHPDAEWMADRVIERLRDSGFEIKPSKPPKARHD